MLQCELIKGRWTTMFVARYFYHKYKNHEPRATSIEESKKI